MGLGGAECRKERAADVFDMGKSLRRRRRPSKAPSGTGDSTVRGVAALADANGIGFTPLLAERANCRRRDPSGFC